MHVRETTSKLTRTPKAEGAPLSPHGSRLKHQQLREQLLEQISAGTLSPGDALPGELQLAEIMQVSRTTVRQTLGDLEKDGIVYRVQGKGTFVSKPQVEEVTARAAFLSLVVPDVASGYHPSLIAGFERAANDVGRPIIVCNSNNEVDKQANQIMRMLDQRVAGILLNTCTQTQTPPYQIQLAQRLGVPVVLLHRAVPGAPAPLLDLPAREIGRRAADAIFDEGHRRIAFIASHRYATSELMEQGIRHSVASHGGTLDDNHIDYGDMRNFTSVDYQLYEQYLEQRMQQLLSGPDRPTAVFVSFDATAEMVYLIAQRMGLQVPRDLSIVSFGGAQRKGAILRRLTSVTVDEEAAASQAVRLLVEMGEGRRPLDSNECLPMQVGISVGATLSSPGK